MNNSEKNKKLFLVWKSLGRLVAEFIIGKKVNKKFLDQYLKATEDPESLKIIHSGQQVIFTTAHIGNWEILLKYNTIYLKSKLAVIYRKVNNPIINNYIENSREAFCIPKGPLVLRKLNEAIESGYSPVILNDQHNSHGEIIDFLGKPAKTSTVLSKLAIKHNLPIIPIYLVRKGKYFIVTMESPIYPKDYKDEVEIAKATNKIVSKWINKYPEQWLWLHRRWKI